MNDIRKSIKRNKMEIKLIVIRTPDTKKLSDFYTLLGLKFEYHKHGNSPFHFSATIGKTVLEIYPLTKNQPEADKNLRLGFGIDNFEEKISILKNNSVKFLTEPIETEFGLIAVVEDTDGRKIELYKN